MSSTKYYFKNSNPVIIEELLPLLSEQQSSALLMLAMNGNTTSAQMENTIQAILENIDWNTQGEQIGKLVNRILPLEQLVPDVYADWRSIVQEAVIFIGSHLSNKRLIPKLIEQITIPEDLTLEQRLIAFISQMPSLQKLGQVIARNRNLDPDFRTELIRLENSISDVSPEQIHAEIKHQLGPMLERYQVEVDEIIHAEASVSAVMRFTWNNSATNNREQGVLKVLKPYIHDYFDENCTENALSEVNLRKLFDDIRLLLEQELDSINEQANLEAAWLRYSHVSGVRVPRLIKELSTSSITAMTYEQGQKVTDTISMSTAERNTLTSHIIEAFIAIPLFASQEKSVFHADPHAGNLYVDEQSRDLIIFDWALTEQLNREQRRQIILLVTSVMLRDEQLIYQAIAELSQDNFLENETKAGSVRSLITLFINDISIFTMPGVKHVLTLLDDILLSGIVFSAPLLIFRKVLLTLDGVLNDIESTVPMEIILAQYLIKEGTIMSCGIYLLNPYSTNFKMPLSSLDILSLIRSAQWFGFRAGLQRVLTS